MPVRTESVTLTPDDIEKIRYLVASQAWTDFFDPMLRGVRRDWMNQLIDPSIARQSARSDDFIRGAIHTIDGFLTFPHLVIEEADVDEARRLADEREREKYVTRTNTGSYGPLPDEDESTSS